MAKLTDDQRFFLATVDIWNCPNAFEFVCPRYWESLEETNDPGVRSCRVCNQQVYRCTTPLDFVSHAELGHCVAVPDDRKPHHGFEKDIIGRPTKAVFDEMRQRVQDTRQWWQEVVGMEPQFAPDAIADVAWMFGIRPSQSRDG